MSDWQKVASCIHVSQADKKWLRISSGAEKGIGVVDDIIGGTAGSLLWIRDKNDDVPSLLGCCCCWDGSLGALLDSNQFYQFLEKYIINHFRSIWNGLGNSGPAPTSAALRPTMALNWFLAIFSWTNSPSDIEASLAKIKTITNHHYQNYEIHFSLTFHLCPSTPQPNQGIASGAVFTSVRTRVIIVCRLFALSLTAIDI